MTTVGKFALTLLAAVLLTTQAAPATVDTAWVRRYDGPAHADDFATAIAVDSGGNVYVVGGSTGIGTGGDFVTIKYYPNGDTAWVRRRDFGGNDRPYGLGVDAQGNVYVAGEGGGRGVTIKYDSAGVLRWVRLCGSHSSGLALDSRGNVLVCGDTYQVSTLDDFMTVKYRSNGDRVWARVYDWAGYEDGAAALVLGQERTLAVTGTIATATTHYDCGTLVYDSTGGQLWAACYDGPQHGTDRAEALAADREGNVIVTGRGDNGYGTPPDYLTVKYGPAGETLWARRYNGTASDWDQANAVATDAAGNAYVTGYARNSVTYNDCVTIKYDTSGETVWLAAYNGPANSSDGGSALSLDGRGCVYAVGSSYGGSSVQTNCLLIKYDGATGETLWVRQYNSPHNGSESWCACAVDRAADVCAAGRGTSPGQDWDILVAKYSGSGSVEERPSADEPGKRLVIQPSPFSGRTGVRITVLKAASVRLVVSDATGRRVRTLLVGLSRPGTSQIAWDGRDEAGKLVPAGVYTFILEAGQTRAQAKVLKLE